MPSAQTGRRRRLGQRYEIGDVLGSGATSTVHLGRLRGTAGFTKIIAIKRLHTHLASDATLRSILVDEARLVSRISHPNVVGVLDVAEEEGELFLVLEYARGATLAELLGGGRAQGAEGGEKKRASPALVVAVMRDVLAGLHAAHHARDAKGEPLALVHRDVTPRNVIATTDGVGKILDFGIAKARARMSTTRDGHVRGSLPYMAPEQIRDETLGSQTDIYAASVVLWEALTGTALFRGESEAAIIQRILDHDVRAPSAALEGHADAQLPAALDAVVLRGLASDPKERFASCLEMAVALEAAVTPATSAEVTAWVKELKEAELATREEKINSGEDGDEDVSASGSSAGVSAGSSAGSSSGSSSMDSSSKSLSAQSPLWTGVLVISALAAVAFVVVIAWPADVKAPRPDNVLPKDQAAHTLPSGAPATSASVAGQQPSAVASVPTASGLVADQLTKPAPSPIRPPAAPPHSATTTSSKAASAKPGDCPPYFVDDAGVRRFNRECLQ